MKKRRDDQFHQTNAFQSCTNNRVTRMRELDERITPWYKLNVQGAKQEESLIREEREIEKRKRLHRG